MYNELQDRMQYGLIEGVGRAIEAAPQIKARLGGLATQLSQLSAETIVARTLSTITDAGNHLLELIGDQRRFDVIQLDEADRPFQIWERYMTANKRMLQQSPTSAYEAADIWIRLAKLDERPDDSVEFKSSRNYIAEVGFVLNALKVPEGTIDMVALRLTTELSETELRERDPDEQRPGRIDDASVDKRN